MEAGEEGEEESGSESEAADSQGDAESTGKKLALYVAQLKAKRG